MTEDIKQALKSIDQLVGRTRLLGIQTNMIWMQRALADCMDLWPRITPEELRARYQRSLRTTVIETERILARLEQLSDENIRLQLEVADWRHEAQRLGGPGLWWKVKHWFIDA